ncbi:MAG TPA: hypothetical protein VFB96_21900 [Pirellulaceae bacterium]|jgi:hypothetical protein|nr:hypothetical protein [Pirellulaceae bacterium]
MSDPLASPPPSDATEPEPIEARIVERPADELRLLPPDCPSSDQFLRQYAVAEEPEPPPPPPPQRFQFSLVDLMVVMIGVAVGLAGGTWMPAEQFAGIMGLLILLGLVLIHFYPLESHGARLAWGTFILAYFVALVAAVFGRRSS